MRKMSEFEEKFGKLSSCSWENRDSVENADAEAGSEEEEFYERLEAPKFVDFRVPDHYHPDDGYWFCLRVGCDQKHEEEMDHEAIYKNFVLRVMAARSPNVKLKKVLDRNNSRTPRKYPLSVPPKPSRPRLSKLAIISSISHKMDSVKKVIQPMSTPKTKVKQVSSKYLTTPGNKRGQLNEISFRSAWDPKPANMEVPRSRVVGKKLVFHSPKNSIKVKTPVELRTPLTKLCERMSRLEITSHRKLALGYSRESFKNLQSNALRPLGESQSSESQAGINGEVKPVKSTIKGKLPKLDVLKKLDNMVGSKIKEDDQHLIAGEKDNDFELQDSKLEEGCATSDLQPQLDNSGLTPASDSNRKDTKTPVEVTNNTGIQAADGEEKDNHDSKENLRFSSENGGKFMNQTIEKLSAEKERNENEHVENDDKENAPNLDENRKDNSLIRNRRKIYGHQENLGEAKKVAQTRDKNLKQRPTNPVPFRLRTDERGILKETNLEKRANTSASPVESADSAGGMLEKKMGKVNKRGITKEAAAPTTSQKHHYLANQQPKLVSSPLGGSKAIQRLEKFRKTESLRLQRAASIKEMTSLLIPGQKLEAIQESPSKIDGLEKLGKASSSQGRQLATVVVAPEFQSSHIPRSRTKKIS